MAITDELLMTTATSGNATLGASITLDGTVMTPSQVDDAFRELMAYRARAITRHVAKAAGTYTAVKVDHNQFWRCTGAVTINLAAAATLTDGWCLWVRANGGAVTIDPSGAETIDGAATLVVPDGMVALVICTGSAFFTWGFLTAATFTALTAASLTAASLTVAGLPAVTQIVERVVTASETYTPDAAVIHVEFELLGGGGGGGGVDGTGTGAAMGGGGGGGEHAFLRVDNVDADPWTITIGAAGLAGAAGNNAGGTGGTTTVTDGTTTCTAIGGTGGSGGLGAVNQITGGGAGGTGGTGGTASRRIAGGRGSWGSAIGNVRAMTGRGGDAPLGWGLGGDQIGTSDANGTVGSGYGAGGSGGQVTAITSNFAGAAGTAGMVLIREFR